MDLASAVQGAPSPSPWLCSPRLAPLPPQISLSADSPDLRYDTGWYSMQVGMGMGLGVGVGRDRYAVQG